MKKTIPALSALLLLVSGICAADFRIYQDYTLSDSVINVTTVRVNQGSADDYLEGLAQTWVAANEVAKELGHIESYSIYASDLPRSGDFNMILVVRFADTAALAPSRERYDAFMQAWGESRRERTQEIAKDYPSMREITGEYNMREVTLLD